MNLNMKTQWLAFLCLIAFSCSQPETEKTTTETTDSNADFVWKTEQFADLKIIRYQIPGFEKLNAKQKELVYYLVQAGLEGRDIMYDQNYRHNLTVRKAFENIVKNYSGDKTDENWGKFMVYMKRIWFSNGIHHHYSNNKFVPDFPREYLEGIIDRYQYLIGCSNTGHPF